MVWRGHSRPRLPCTRSFMRGQPPQPAHALPKAPGEAQGPRQSAARLGLQKNFIAVTERRSQRKSEAVQSAALHMSGLSRFGKEIRAITFCEYSDHILCVGYVRSSRIIRGTRAEGVGSDPEISTGNGKAQAGRMRCALSS